LNIELASLLRCPKSGLALHQEGTRSSDVHHALVSEDGSTSYPIVGGIPRFVSSDNYASNFGMQWNKFARTQLDSYSGVSISSDRFWRSLGCSPSSLRGKRVLDAGCGSGRFAEIALQAGAKVVALDFSTAVDACKENLGDNHDFLAIQANILEPPFADQSFDVVYSLGVLQHTPDPHAAFRRLARLVRRDGGVLCVDFYRRSLASFFEPRYWMRPFVKGVPDQNLFESLERLVPKLLRVSNLVLAIPLVGQYLARLIPVANYRGRHPLSEKQIEEWALLDTFDWLAPTYDNPKTESELSALFDESGFRDIEVLNAGHLVGRGRLG
jgi:ubiquinone/menaquinone biosynthesis C-methylase UbiE